MTYLGDADLYISTSQDNTHPTILNYDYTSERRDQYDEVTLTDDTNVWLSKYIYIGVYAHERSEFVLSLTPTYHPTATK
jgi:hypothetical protein